ncbi:MAG TPA: META domain-containing protein [Methanospirillum sp.]|nr:META domain-containing protein [Methanospirillum sp.]
MQTSVGLFMALVLLFSGISFVYGEAGVSDPTDPVGSWRVVSFLNLTGALVAPIAGSEITATFGPDWKLSGNDGCASYSAEYTIGSGAMLISPATQMSRACCEELTAQEQNFFADLKGVARAEKNETTLKLFDDDDQLLIELTRRQGGEE